MTALMGGEAVRFSQAGPQYGLAKALRLLLQYRPVTAILFAQANWWPLESISWSRAVGQARLSLSLLSVLWGEFTRANCHHCRGQDRLSASIVIQQERGGFRATHAERRLWRAESYPALCGMLRRQSSDACGAGSSLERTVVRCLGRVA